MWSEAIDTAIQRAGRPDRKADCKGWASLTLQEMQAKGILKRNIIEDTIDIGNSTQEYIWQRPQGFQRMQTARYPQNVFPEFCPPGKRQLDYPNRYYTGSTYYVFAGPDLYDHIDVAYYKLQMPLPYFADGKRPRTYDVDMRTVVYHNLTTAGTAPYNLDYTDPANQAAADQACTNWILTDYWDLFVEGILAKIFKAVNDEVRAGTHFSYFERNKQDTFFATEVLESL